MTWFRVDDQFYDHPKVLALREGKHEDAAVALWAKAGSWSAAKLTDGDVPTYAVETFVRKNAIKAADELVRVGLWETTEAGYRFRDWHDYQPTKAEVTEKRNASKDRVRRFRERNGNAASNVVGNALQNALVTPPPTRPDPTRPEESESARGEVGIETGPIAPPVAPSDPLFAPRWHLINGFRKRWESARGLMWPGHQHNPDPTESTRWLLDACQKHGVPFEAAADDILDRWFAEDWPRKQKFPWRTFCKQIPNYVPDAPDVPEVAE